MREFFSLKNHHSVVPLCGFEVSRATKGAPCSVCVNPVDNLFDYYGGCNGGPWPVPNIPNMPSGNGPVWNHDIHLDLENIEKYFPLGEYSALPDSLKLDLFTRLENVSGAPLPSRNAGVSGGGKCYFIPMGIPYSGYHTGFIQLSRCEGCNVGSSCGPFVIKLPGPTVQAMAVYDIGLTESVVKGDRTLFTKVVLHKIKFSEPFRTVSSCYGNQYLPPISNPPWSPWEEFQDTITLTLIEPPV